MKALSLFQPYAALIALQQKRWETRCWQTHLRGTIAIASTAAMPQEAKLTLIRPAFQKALAPMKRSDETSEYYDLPCGAIIAVADIAEVITTSEWLRRFARRPGYLPEFEFGDYSPNRFAWRLENVRALKQPIPAKGSQRLWSVSKELEEKINAQLSES